MSIEQILIGASMATAIGSAIGFIILACRVYSLDVELNAMKKSTHKIQWMPLDEAWAQSEKDVNKAFEADVGHEDDLRGI